MMILGSTQSFSSAANPVVRQTTRVLLTQSRGWFDPNLTRQTGRPAFSRAKDFFVARDIPVVLLKDCPNLGVKGQIVQVKRGFARRVLIPSGAAVYGTQWENIDRFASPTVIEAEAALAKQSEMGKAKVAVHPFDWINGIKLRFVRDSNMDGHVKEPVSIWQILNKLSREYQLDILPEDILENFPDVLLDPVYEDEASEAPSLSDRSGIVSKFKGMKADALAELAKEYPKFVKLGEHDIDIGLTFKPDVKKKFTIKIDLVSSSEEMETLRKMRASEKPVFLLGVKEKRLTNLDKVEDEEA